MCVCVCVCVCEYECVHMCVRVCAILLMGGGGGVINKNIIFLAQLEVIYRSVITNRRSGLTRYRKMNIGETLDC